MVALKLHQGRECVTNVARQIKFRPEMFRGSVERLGVEFAAAMSSAELGHQTFPRVLPQDTQPRELLDDRSHLGVAGDAGVDCRDVVGIITKVS